MLWRSLFLVLVLSGCASSGVKTQQAMVFYDRADAYYEQGNYGLALADYQRLERLFPREPVFPLRIGNCLAFEMRYEEAVAAYERALVLDPRSTRAWYNLSFVRAQILAATVVRMYDHIDPADPDVQRMRQLTAEVLQVFDQTLDLPESSLKADHDEQATGELPAGTEVSHESP